MTEDLTKLTVKELTCQPHITSELWSEILRRLERLEKCEADYKRCCELNEKLCHEVHDLKAALDGN